MKKKNGYIARRDTRDRVMIQAARETYQQFMVDTLILTLNDPDVMGNDAFGYDRLKRVLDGWGRYSDHYIEALGSSVETDYWQEKLDEAIRRIVGNKAEFVPFAQRYEWLKEIRYDKK